MKKSYAHLGDLIEKKDRNVDKVSTKIFQFNSAWVFSSLQLARCLTQGSILQLK